jgi:hypothetical protein
MQLPVTSWPDGHLGIFRLPDWWRRALGLIVSAARIRSANVFAGRSGRPVTAGFTRRRLRAFGALCALGALALSAFFLVAHFSRAVNQVVRSPTRAQVVGTWVGDYDLVLVLRADGTFTSAALPAQVGTAEPVLSSGGSYVVNAWSAHGTWSVGSGDLGGSAKSVIFTVNCGPGTDRCAGHPATFELQLETNAPAGGGGPALFYYLGTSHDLNSQYPFVRGQ